MRTLIFLVFSLLLVACQPQSLQTDRLLAEWEQQGDLSALATLNQRCVQLAENDLADSVFTICSQLFRRFPEEVSGSPDSLSYAVSRAFYNFHSSAVRPEQRQQFIHITDSLVEVGHPCLTTTYRYLLRLINREDGRLTWCRCCRIRVFCIIGLDNTRKGLPICRWRLNIWSNKGASQLLAR